jgi:hypothetical protein
MSGRMMKRRKKAKKRKRSSVPTTQLELAVCSLELVVVSS